MKHTVIIHVHSKNGHAGVIPILQARLASCASSLDPMNDGSTVTAFEIHRVAVIPNILAISNGLTLIPCDGTMGKTIAALLAQYGVKDTFTKKDVLTALHGTQANDYFHPVLCDV